MMAHTLARALVDRGHRVEVLLSFPLPWLREPYDYQGVRVHPARDAKADPFLWFSGPDRADVVVTHLENTPRAVTLGKMYGVPAVHLLHNDHGPTRAWCNPDVALVVSNTAWIAQQVDHPNLIVVRPPVIPVDYATTPGDAVTLINVNPDKGAHVFYALAERFPDQKFIGVEGSYGEQINRTDLPNVEWIAHVPGHQMRERVYARTRVLLMPSIYESYGRTAVEAMVSGIPVIAHPTPGLCEALADAGTYAHREDIDAWQAALQTLLTSEAWQTASNKAVRRAAELDPADDLDRWCIAIEALAT